MVVVRPARSHETALLAEIGFRAWLDKLDVWASGQDDIDTLKRNARDAFSNFAATGWRSVLVAEQEGVVSGWGARESQADGAEFRPQAISDLWIDPQWQRRGLGTALMDTIENDIRDLGYDHAELETHVLNAGAITFYKTRGYAIKWLSTRYSPGLDRDVEKIGLEKAFGAMELG